MTLYWLINFAPDWTIHALVGISLVALFITWFVNSILFVNKYFTPIQIIASVLLVYGIYLEGAMAYKHSTDLAVAELKVKLAEAEAKANKVNTDVNQQVDQKTKILRLKGDTVVKYIDKEVPKYDSQCKLPDEVINAHNMAATLSTDIKDNSHE